MASPVPDRYGPSVSRLIAEADSGRVGDVRMVSIREHRFPFLKKVGDWNRLRNIDVKDHFHDHA